MRVITYIVRVNKERKSRSKIHIYDKVRFNHGDNVDNTKNYLFLRKTKNKIVYYNYFFVDAQLINIDCSIVDQDFWTFA